MWLSKLRLPALCALALLAACTASPLHAPITADPLTGEAQSAFETLAGRIAVVEPDSRTDQVVRNALLFRLNGAKGVRDPLYEVRLVTVASDRRVSIEGGGSGVPTASVYRLQANYTLRRLSDGQVLASGSRFSTAPYDRSVQQFASQRALLNARENAASEVGERVVAALQPVLRRELTGEVSGASVLQPAAAPPLGTDDSDFDEPVFRQD